MNQPSSYSPRPLVDKLGIKANDHVLLFHAPDNYLLLLGDLPPGVLVYTEPREDLNLIQLFVTHLSELTTHFKQLSSCLKPNGMLWVCWPKQSAKIDTDLNENKIRDFGLSSGMVDVKVIAINDVWSGLKFVYRLRDRPKNSEKLL